jgi:hypothetical protein
MRRLGAARVGENGNRPSMDARNGNDLGANLSSEADKGECAQLGKPSTFPPKGEK